MRQRALLSYSRYSAIFWQDVGTVIGRVTHPVHRLALSAYSRMKVARRCPALRGLRLAILCGDPNSVPTTPKGVPSGVHDVQRWFRRRRLRDRHPAAAACPPTAATRSSADHVQNVPFLQPQIGRGGIEGLGAALDGRHGQRQTGCATVPPPGSGPPGRTRRPTARRRC